MPKQGHFAKSTRIKQLNQFKVKKQAEGNTIDEDQFIDYVLVRFALTTKRSLPKLAGETYQRLIMEICAELNPGNNDLQNIITHKLADLQSRVPWQFYQQVITYWEPVQHFLQREIPAVPVKQRVLISNPVDDQTLQQYVARLIAHQTTAAMFLKRPVNQLILNQTDQRLLTVIFHDDQLDWAKVAALWAPFPFEPADNLDDGTREWLLQLATLK